MNQWRGLRIRRQC